jgi:hypothetical protein
LKVAASSRAKPQTGFNTGAYLRKGINSNLIFDAAPGNAPNYETRMERCFREGITNKFEISPLPEERIKFQSHF